MALNWIWFLFFGVAFVVAIIQFVFFGNTEIFKILVDGMFDSAEMAVMILIVGQGPVSKKDQGGRKQRR